MVLFHSYVNSLPEGNHTYFHDFEQKKALEILTFSVQCGLFCHMLELHQSNQKGGYAVPAINHPCHISRNEWVATQSRLDVFHVPQTSSQRKMNVFQNGGGTPKIIHV